MGPLRSRLAWLLATGLALSSVAVLGPPSATAAAASSNLVDESFKNSSLDDTLTHWISGGSGFRACLTSSADTTKRPVPGCPAGQSFVPAGGDPNGSGALRMTSNQPWQASYLLYDSALPVTAGLVAEFRTYSYGGSNYEWNGQRGADGISFFLADGQFELDEAGADGGSLGYADRINNSSGAAIPGIEGGYLGLGIDEFGNYSYDAEGRGTGCPATPLSGFSPDTLALRGPGTGTSGYCLEAIQKLPAGATIDDPYATSRLATGVSNTFRISFDAPSDPSARFRVEADYGDGTGFHPVMDVPLPRPTPSTIKFGFASSTGGLVNVHEIQSMKIQTINPLPQWKVSATPPTDLVSGGTGTATLTASTSPASTAGVAYAPPTVTYQVPAGLSLATLPSGDGWDCSASDLATSTLTCTYRGIDQTHPAPPGTALPPLSVPLRAATTTSGAFTDTSTITSSDNASDVQLGPKTPTTTPVSVPVKPVGADDTATTDAGNPVDINVLDNDKGDLDPSTVTVAGPGPAHGTVNVDPATGVITYSPVADYSGPDTFVYTVRDSSGQTIRQQVTVMVSPHAVDDVAATTSEQPVTVAVLANDKGALTPGTLVAPAKPSHGSVTVSDGTLTYTPNPGFSGTDSFTYAVSDNNGRTTQATVSVVVSAAARADTATTNIDTPIAIAVLANDVGAIVPGTVAVPTPPQHGTTAIHPDGSITYTPAPGFTGPDTFTYSVRTADGQTLTQSVSVLVKPVGGADSATTLAAQPVNIDVLANDSPSIDPASLATATPPAHGSAQVTNGTITYTPAPGFSGVDTFTYTAKDTSGTAITEQVTVFVRPAAAPDTAITTAGMPVTVSELANDLGNLDPASVSVQRTPTNGTVTVGPGGHIVYLPNAGFSGQDTFVYEVRDSSGGSSDPTVVTVTVTPTSTPDAATTAVNTSVTIDVLANDKGALDTTTFKVTPAAHGTTQIVNGRVLYTPAKNFSGSDSFTYTVLDDSGQSITETATVRVTPSATDDVATGISGDPLAPPVVLNVLDNDAGTLNPAQLTITRPASNGSTAIDPVTGSITYTPNPRWSGIDTFAYTTVDQDGQPVTANATVTITPDARPDAYYLPADSPGRTIAVLANDNGNLAPSTLIASKPAHGNLTVNADGSVTYIPNRGYSGSDLFTYTVRDHAGSATTAEARVLVAPSATADTASTKRDTPVTINVAANDLGRVVPPSVFIRNPPQHGTTTVNPDGTVTYRPAAGYVGTDGFTYVITDAESLQAEAPVELTITSPTTPPAPTSPVTPGPASTSTELPFTGTSIQPTLGIATALLCAGGWLTALTQRRRRRHQ